MGIWTWLSRIPAEHGDGASPEHLSSSSWLEQHATERIHINRCWHAIHVLLTGSEGEAPPPASWVAYDGSTRIVWEGHSHAITSCSPEEVQFISAHLQYQVDFEKLLVERYPKLFYETPGLYVYDFGTRDPARPDLIETGAVEKAFRELRRFYGEAAEHGELVIKTRG